MPSLPPLASLAGLLVGMWLLVILGGGVVVLAGHLLGRVVRAHRDRRHPRQAAARRHTQQARRLAAEWPLLAQTLGLGYRDQWTRQHASPRAQFVADGDAGPLWAPVPGRAPAARRPASRRLRRADHGPRALNVRARNLRRSLRR